MSARIEFPRSVRRIDHGWSRSRSRPPRRALFSAVVEGDRRAVFNALWQAEPTVGRAGIVAERLPHDELLELLREHGRLSGHRA